MNTYQEPQPQTCSRCLDDATVLVGGGEAMCGRHAVTALPVWVLEAVTT